MLNLEGRDYCRNEGIELGYRGFTNKYRTLPNLPPSQPAALKHYFADFDPDNVPASMKALGKSHQVSHACWLSKSAKTRICCSN